MTAARSKAERQARWLQRRRLGLVGQSEHAQRRDERRATVRTALLADPTASNAELAARYRVGHRTVTQVRAELAGQEPRRRQRAAGAPPRTAAAELAAVLGSLPDLRGALCAGRPSLWDERAPEEEDSDTAARYRLAIAECARCPALAACRRWVESLPPSKRPPGVTAGWVNPK